MNKVRDCGESEKDRCPYEREIGKTFMDEKGVRSSSKEKQMRKEIQD